MYVSSSSDALDVHIPQLVSCQITSSRRDISTSVIPLIPHLTPTRLSRFSAPPITPSV